MTNVTDILSFKKAKPVESPESLVGLHDSEPPPSSIHNTAAGQVLGALQFYAMSGFDHGEKAKKALIGMRSVVESLPTQSA